MMALAIASRCVELSKKVVLYILPVIDMHTVQSFECNQCHLRLDNQPAGIFCKKEDTGIGNPVAISNIQTCQDVTGNYLTHADICLFQKVPYLFLLDVIPCG